MLVIILGSRARYDDFRALYAFYQTNYRWVTLDRGELTALNRLYGPGQALWYLRATGAAPQLLIHPWEFTQLRAYRRLNLPTVGVEWIPGMEVGVLEWWLGDERIDSQTLVLW